MIKSNIINTKIFMSLWFGGLGWFITTIINTTKTTMNRIIENIVFYF